MRWPCLGSPVTGYTCAPGEMVRRPKGAFCCQDTSGAGQPKRARDCSGKRGQEYYPKWEHILVPTPRYLIKKNTLIPFACFLGVQFLTLRVKNALRGLKKVSPRCPDPACLIPVILGMIIKNRGRLKPKRL
jgi:hypothetical protein